MESRGGEEKGEGKIQISFSTNLSFPTKKSRIKEKEKLIARASLRSGQNGQNLYLNKISTNE